MKYKSNCRYSSKVKSTYIRKGDRRCFQACRYFAIWRETYYQWKRDYEREGERALINSKPCPQNPKIKVPKHVVELITYLRTNYYYLGQLRISWYLKRYHNIGVTNKNSYLSTLSSNSNSSIIPRVLFNSLRITFAAFTTVLENSNRYFIIDDLKIISLYDQDSRPLKEI